MKSKLRGFWKELWKYTYSTKVYYYYEVNSAGKEEFIKAFNKKMRTEIKGIYCITEREAYLRGKI